MKKKIAVLALSIACILLLSACGAMIPTNFSANWLKSPSDTHDPNFYEKLNYGVSFKSSGMQDSLSGLTIDSENSSYSIETETLSSYSHNNTTYERVYHMHTELILSGTYAYIDKSGAKETLFSFGGEHDTAETDADDAAKMTTDVWFYSLADSKNLQPIYSKSSFFSYSPAGLNGKNINLYNYSYEIEYNEDCSEAKIIYSDNYKELKPEERNVSAYLYKTALFNITNRTFGDLQKSHTCVDHSQLLFAIRGVNYKENLSVNVTSVNGEIGKQTLNVACKEFVESNITFNLDGEAEATEHKIPCAKLDISITGNGTNTGGMHSVLLAKRTSDERSEFYCMPMRIESPYGFGLGTLEYSLQSATHTR